ncbi:septum site-determining protein Ssd [Corynebacterium sp.]|uniref:septum site-determining protein Ssd n=1 Tax=Corynebacterium sp. TaxID=1720 RepID=UPI0026DC3461|nr:septum site-determining protein Ssd [Corynebacterium sp.]MDO5031870.1 septum formation initiator [Corynebacterium sp.]
MNTQLLALAVGDSALRAEAASAAAASTAEVLTIEDPRDFPRYLPKADVVIADALTAGLVAEHPRVFFVAADPGPIDYEAALRCHAQAAFILPAESKGLLAALAQESHPSRETISAPTVAVTGSAGGVGTSTLALAIAREADAALLVDASPYSGGLDLLAGIESEPGARWPDFAAGTGAVDPVELARALPSAGGLAVLSAARSTTPVSMKPARRESIIQAACLHPAPVVIDCPAWDVPVGADHVIILTAAEVRSAAACAEVVAILRARKQPCSVVVRHRQWSGLDANDIAALVHTEPIAEIPTLRGLTKACETGGLPRRLPGSLRAAAQAAWEAAAWEVAV